VPTFRCEIERGRRYPSARWHLPARERAILRAGAEGIDAVAEDRASVSRAAGLQPTHGAGERQNARVVAGRWIRGRASVHRSMFHELAVIRPQHIEAAVLTAGSDDFGRF